MAEQDVAKRTEEFRRKKEELKRRAFEDELRRVERETEERGKELANMLRSKDEHLYQERLREVESKRNQEEESLRKRESEIQSKLADERRKKQSRRQEENLLRREEEESRRSSIEAKIRSEDNQKKAADDAARKKASEEDAQKKAEDDARRRVEELKAKREEEARLKAEEVRLRSEEEERQRAEQETRSRADQDRRRQEEQLRIQREEFQRQDEERRRQEEQRRIDAERKRKEDEERRAREAEERRRQEEERRIREEAETKIRLEREAREREEAEARREIEERQRKEADAIKQRADELQRERDEHTAKERNEKEARILDLMTKAENLFTQGDLKAALVEVAKALVNDPKNPAARELERTIKEELGTLEPKKEDAPAAEEKPRQVRKRITGQRRITESDVKKPFFTKTLIVAICAGVIAAGAILFVQYKDKLFPKEITFAIVPWTSSANIAEETTLGTALSEEVAREFEGQTKAGMLGYSSTFALMHSSPDPTRSIFALGYPYILEGSLTKSAVGFNLSVRLVDSVGSVYWAQTFIKSEASLPSLPAEVAAQVAKAVGMNASFASGTAAPLSTSSVNAYGAYLRGCELMRHGTQESNAGALALFRQAIAEDVNFSDAYAYAASSFLTMYERGWNKNDSVLATGKQLAEAAVSANARGTLGHVVLARIYICQKNYGGALDHLESALKLSPGNSEVYVQRGFLFLRLGKDKEAMESLGRAYELNPRDGSVLRMMGLALQFAGTPAQATWYHQTAVFDADDSTEYIAGPLADALILDPAFSPRDARRVSDAFERRLQANPRSYRDLYRLGRMQQVTGNVRQGSATLENAEKILRDEIRKNPKNTDALTTLGLALTRLGQFAEANALAHKALDIAGDDVLTKYRVAQVLSLQLYSAQTKKTDDKKKEEALGLLREAVARDYNLGELANGDFYNMHDLPEFRAAISVPHR